MVILVMMMMMMMMITIRAAVVVLGLMLFTISGVSLLQWMAGWQGGATTTSNSSSGNWRSWGCCGGRARPGLRTLTNRSWAG